MNRDEGIKKYKQENDFVKRLDMLALSLSLKKNTHSFDSSEGYRLLFTTYIKMFENDVDHFFIDLRKQEKFIESLNRTKELYDCGNVEVLEDVFEHMTKNDPADFMLFPVLSQSRSIRLPYLLWKLVVYKKENDYMVVHVDVKERFDLGQVSYARVPKENVADLCKILAHSSDLLNPRNIFILRAIDEISSGFQQIPEFLLARDFSSKGGISEVEACLNVILSHCQEDMFRLGVSDKSQAKRNLVFTESNLELRRRFLEAVKGENPLWNVQFDYVFDHYLYRIGEIAKNSTLPEERDGGWWYINSQAAFEKDPYIRTLMNNKGGIPRWNEKLIQKRLGELVEPLSELYDQELSQVPIKQLKSKLHQDAVLLTMNEDRLATIKIPFAKEMSKRLLSKLDERHQEITDEINRRGSLELKKKHLKYANHWLTEFAMKFMPISIKNYFLSESIEKKQSDEFIRRVDMLALTLSLKRNSRSFFPSEFYELLFSTYIKMIENDPNHFFIDPIRRPKIIQSLERTLELYKLEEVGSLQTIFENLKNNDPTDFMLFPACYSLLNPAQRRHVSGLTVYKRDNQYVVIQVDKEEHLREGSVSYVHIPLEKIEELSRIFFASRHALDLKPFGILRKIEALSHPFKAIPSIILASQTTGNCLVSEVEASLKIALYNCQKDIFASPQTLLTPKWNLTAPATATIEMRKRFLVALKGSNEEWNQNFDYLFDYYLYRKKKCEQLVGPDSDQVKQVCYDNVREYFNNDPYLVQIFKSGGRIPSALDLQSEEKINQVEEPLGSNYKEKIKTMDIYYLNHLFEYNKERIEWLKEKIPTIKIPVAKEMTEALVIRIECKNKEMESEIQQREKLAEKKQLTLHPSQDRNQLDVEAVRVRVQERSPSSGAIPNTTASFVPLENRVTIANNQIRRFSTHENKKETTKRVASRMRE